MRHIINAIPLALALVLGCGGKSAAPPKASPILDDSGNPVVFKKGAPHPGKEKDSDGKPVGQAQEELTPKVIFTANVNVIVDEFDKATERLDALLKEHKG